MRWFKLMYLMKVLHLDRLSCFFWSIFLVIFLGTVLKPHTKACPYGRAFVPSSLHLTITAFLPAYRPLVTTTTLPPARVKKEEEKIHLVSLLSNVKEDFPVERRMEKRNVQREGGREQAANRGGNVDSFGRKYRTRANDESSTNTRNLVKNAFEPVFWPRARASDVSIVNTERDSKAEKTRHPLEGLPLKTNPESARVTRIAKGPIGCTPWKNTSNRSYLSKI